MKCDSRLQLSDMGYHECQLNKNHEGDHKYTKKKGESWVRTGYTISWEKDEINDTNINVEWLKKNTNLFQLLDEEILNYSKYFSHYEVDDQRFNDPLYGDDFTLCIDLYCIAELRELLDNWNEEEYLKFKKKFCIFKYGEYKEDYAYLDIDDDFRETINKRLLPDLHKYKFHLSVSMI